MVGVGLSRRLVSSPWVRARAAAAVNLRGSLPDPDGKGVVEPQRCGEVSPKRATAPAKAVLVVGPKPYEGLERGHG